MLRIRAATSIEEEWPFGAPVYPGRFAVRILAACGRTALLQPWQNV